MGFLRIWLLIPGIRIPAALKKKNLFSNFFLFTNNKYQKTHSQTTQPHKDLLKQAKNFAIEHELIPK